MEKLIDIVVMPLLTRVGTFVGGSVIALGATSEQAAEIQTYVFGIVLIMADLAIRRIVGKK